jgi:hypothetical protein
MNVLLKQQYCWLHKLRPNSHCVRRAVAVVDCLAKRYMTYAGLVAELANDAISLEGIGADDDAERVFIDLAAMPHRLALEPSNI